jgi:hypothetical protein
VSRQSEGGYYEIAQFAFPYFHLAMTCAAQSSCNVGANLDWCARGHGFNEGATCGLNALTDTLNAYRL